MTMVMSRGGWFCGWVLACTFVVVGCSSSAPGAFTKRAVLASCGEVEDRPVAVSAPGPRAALDCFVSARTSGDSAEIVVVRFSKEGHPDREWVRTLVGGAVEMWQHTTADSFGGDNMWTFATCQALGFDQFGVPTPTGCATPPRK